jgi:hypothetical protein
MPITPTSCPLRSPVSRTISRPASRTCGSRSRTVASQGRRISSNGCSSRTATAEDHSQRLRRKAGAQAHVRRAHPASASPNSSSVRSPPAEKNSTTNIRLQSRRWPGQPSPELPANPNLDLRETPRQKNLHAGTACCSAARRSGAEEMRTNSPKAERSISSSIVSCAAAGSLFQRPRSPPSPR